MARLQMIDTWRHCPGLELLHDPPISPYTNAFVIMENPPMVDAEG